jgi:hypothetical protein
VSLRRMHSVATFQRVRGLSAQQPQVATRRRGGSSPLSGKVRAAGADDSRADPLDRTDKKDTNSSFKALYYNAPYSRGSLSWITRPSPPRTSRSAIRMWCVPRGPIEIGSPTYRSSRAPSVS